jgi:hypothetical protein
MSILPNSVSRASSVVFITSLFAAALCAQTSEISGRILDPSRSALSGAKVTLTRTDTGYQRSTLSSQEGYYGFPLLAPGSYEIAAERDGFQTQTRAGITVQTGVISTVELQLQVGSVSQAVTVTESAPLLEAGTSAITHVVENKTIAGMPCWTAALRSVRV